MNLYTDAYPCRFGVVGTVFRPQLHIPDSVARKLARLKVSTHNGVNDVLEILEIGPYVRRDGSIARRLLHRGLNASLLALRNASESNSYKEEKIV